MVYYVIMAAAKKKKLYRVDCRRAGKRRNSPCQGQALFDVHMYALTEVLQSGLDRAGGSNTSQRRQRGKAEDSEQHAPASSGTKAVLWPGCILL